MPRQASKEGERAHRLEPAPAANTRGFLVASIAVGVGGARVIPTVVAIGVAKCSCCQTKRPNISARALVSHNTAQSLFGLQLGVGNWIYSKRRRYGYQQQTARGSLHPVNGQQLSAPFFFFLRRPGLRERSGQQKEGVSASTSAAAHTLSLGVCKRTGKQESLPQWSLTAGMSYLEDSSSTS